MIRLFLTLFFLVGIVIAGDWLLDNPGEVVIRWFDYDISLHIVVVVALLAVVLILVSMFSVGFWQVMTWGKRRRKRREFRTLQSGLRQLTLGVTALAMGDEVAAQEALQKATSFLPNDPLPQLLTAQLLQRQGKYDDARAEFKRLMLHEATAALATRKLIEQHVASREWGEASQLTEDARKEAPKDRWLVLTQIDLYARGNNSTAMLALTEGWQWKSPLTKQERHRYAAIAHYLAAQKEPLPHRREQALRHSVGYAPDFLPSIIAFAETLVAENDLRRARKWLLNAWIKKPALILIQPILATLKDSSSRDQQRLLRPFLKGAQQAVHHLLFAQQAFSARDFERAKTEAEASLTREESKAACSLMAEIEKELNGVGAANAWLARALDAPAGETWICHDCGTQHTQWQMHCSNCNHFDSLRYERPETRITSVELATTSQT